MCSPCRPGCADCSRRASRYPWSSPSRTLRPSTSAPNTLALTLTQALTFTLTVTLTCIKAFYLGADDILEWSRAHPEYSVRQISGLVALTGVSTQAKKKLLTALETR